MPSRARRARGTSFRCGSLLWRALTQVTGGLAGCSLVFSNWARGTQQTLGVVVECASLARRAAQPLLRVPVPSRWASTVHLTSWALFRRSTRRQRPASHSAQKACWASRALHGLEMGCEFSNSACNARLLPPLRLHGALGRFGEVVRPGG